jgi:hypothetical protein
MHRMRTNYILSDNGIVIEYNFCKKWNLCIRHYEEEEYKMDWPNWLRKSVLF